MTDPMGSGSSHASWDDTTLPLRRPADRSAPSVNSRQGIAEAPAAAAMPPMPAHGSRTASGGLLPPSAPRNATYQPPSRAARRERPLWPDGRPVRQARRRRGARMLGTAALLAVLVLLAIATTRVYAFGAAISSKGPLTTQTGYMTGSERVNLLVLGFGGGSHDGAYLTDSMMVVSMMPGDSATTLISVPRDLWVQVPPGSGQYAKINTAYQDGLYHGFGALPPGQEAAGTEAARKVSDVLGIDVPYWLTIDFQGFRQLVDSLGGVDITVPKAFTAKYPRNDDPKIDAGWKIIHFTTGPQHMNGEQAIEYARARYVLDPLSEASDFARSGRQQLLIRAILSRARQPSAWPGVTGATNALQRSLYTNLSLADLARFSQKLDFNTAQRVSLQDVLVDGVSDDGQDILLPRGGDWSAIQQYIAAHLKS